jgi:PAS domain S-box-containing protein
MHIKFSQRQWKYWEQLTLPHPSIQGPERRRVRVLSALLLSIILLGVGTLVWKQFGDGPIVNVAISAITIAVLAIAYGFSRTKYYRVAYALTILSVWGFSISGSMIDHNPQTLYFMIFSAFIGSLFLAPRGTVLVSLCSVFLIVLLSLVSPIFYFSNIINPAFMVAVAGALATVATLVQSQDFRHIAQQSDELSERVQELSQGQEALLRSETRLSNILENAAEAIISLDERQNIILFNRGAEQIFGYLASEVLGEPLDLLLPESFVEHHRQHVKIFGANPATSQPMGARQDVLGRRKDGSQFPAQVGISAHVENGQVISTAILIDVSERKLAEEMSKQSEARLQLQINRMPIGCIVWDTQLRVTSWNPAAERIFGFSSKEVLGNCPFDLIVAENARTPINIVLDQLFKGNTIARVTSENLTKDGQTIICEWSNTQLNGPDGKIIGVFSMVQDITARVRAQEDLLASEERYHNLFDRLPVALYRTSPQGQILEANPALIELLGYPDRETLQATNVSELFVNPGERIQENSVLERKGVARDIQFQLRCYDGRLIWVQDTARIVKDANGTTNYEGSLEDISERKRARETIHQRNEDLTLINAINSAVNRGESLKTIIELISDEAKRIFESMGTTLYLLNEGRDRLVMQNLALSSQMAAQIEKLFNVSIPSIEHDLGKENLFQEVMESKQGRLVNDPAQIQEFIGSYIESSPFTDTVRDHIKKLVPALVRLLGQKSLVLVPLVAGNEAIGTLEMGSRSMLTEDDLHRFESIAGQLTAAIQRKQTDDKLAASESKLRALFAAMQDVVLIIDQDGIYREIAPTNPGLLYEPPEKLLGKALQDIFPVQEAELFVSAIREVLATGKLKQVEYQLQIGDISHWFLANITPISETATVWVAHDITDRKRAEEVLRESELRYQTLAEISPVGIFRTDPQGETIYVNPRWCQLSGMSASAASGNGWLSAVHPEDREALVSGWRQATQSQNISRKEYRFLRPDGTVAWVMGHAVPEKDTKGNIVSYVGTITDITERRQVELALQRVYDEVTEHAHSMETLNRIGQRLTAILSQEEIIEQLGNECSNLFRTGNFALILYDEAKEEFEMKFYMDRGKRKASERFSLGHGLTSIVISKKEQILAEDYIKECEKWGVEPLGNPSKAWIGVPIIAGEKTLGALLVWDYESEGSFRTYDLGIVSTLASQAAVSFENARLFEDAQRRLRQTLALREVDQAIAGSMNIHQVLEVVLKHTLIELGVDAAVILLYDSTDKVLKYALGSGFKTTALQFTRLQLGEGYAGQVALGRRIVHISNLRTRTTDFLRSPAFHEEGFECYFGVPLIAKGEIKGVLEIFQRAPIEPKQEWLDFMETLANQIAIAIDNATLYKDLQRSNVDLTMAYEKTIEGWSRALDLRDKETEGHTQRVTELTMKLSRIMGLSEDDIVHIQRGALLHDIGKMGVPDRILLKPDKLTDEEWKIMRLHPVFAYEMLYPIEYLHPALDIPYCHHEKWDGTGYPHGLKGEQIPLAARIFAVVDVWDALTSDRPYRPAWSKKKAMDYIREQSNTHFDPQVVAAFLKAIEE